MGEKKRRKKKKRKKELNDFQPIGGREREGRFVCGCTLLDYTISSSSSSFCTSRHVYPFKSIKYIDKRNKERRKEKKKERKHYFFFVFFFY